MTFELLFLGTGTSAGVPMIGCDCGVCRSGDPRDQRTRPSALVSYPDPHAEDAEGRPVQRQVLIDASPDLRTQAVRHELMRLDAVMITHAHADHIFGIDDLRRFNAVMESPLDLYAEPEVLKTLGRTFPYIFEPHRNVNPSFVAKLIPHAVELDQPVKLHGASWRPVRLMHGRLPILGFRIDTPAGSIAYCTDVSTIPPQTYPQLAGLDVLVIDALRYRHHPTHLTVEQALDVVAQLEPGRAFFTHIAHDIRHDELTPRLPEGVALAYDGLRVRVEAGAGRKPDALGR